MFTMTRIVTLSVVHSVIHHLSPFFNLWVPDKLGYLYSPQLEDERFFRIINDLGNDFRWDHAPWLGFIYNRQPMTIQDGRRHRGLVHSRSQRQDNNLSQDREFRFRTRVRTPFQFKFYSNDANTIERLEEHFVAGPFKKDLIASITLDAETYEIGFRLSYGGEDSETEIGALEKDPYGLVSTLTRSLYATYPILWFYQDRDGNLVEVDPLTGEPVIKKVIRNVHLRVYYKDPSGDPVLLFEEEYSS